MLIFVRVRSKSHFTIGFFHIILCWRLIKTKNTIMQIFTLQILRVLNNLLNKLFILFLCKDFPTGSEYFTYICLYLSSWGRLWICTRSWFFMVNTISNEWYSLYYLLHAIILCYRPVLSSLTCSCLWNALSLPVSQFNVGSVVSRRCCKPHR